jgi:hypothetical protein
VYEKILIITEYDQILLTNIGGRIGEEFRKVSDFWHAPKGFWKLARAFDCESPWGKNHQRTHASKNILTL